MPTITVTLDERVYRALMLASGRKYQPIENLAMGIIENAVTQMKEFDEVLPPQYRNPPAWRY